MDMSWLNGNDFQWLKPTQPDGTFLRGMELGVRMRHAQINSELAQRELEGKLNLMQANARLKDAEIRAYENTAVGNAELAQVLSDGAGDWTNPQVKQRFWETASKYPHVMKSPQFKELVDNFQLADQAKARAELLGQRQEGQLTLEQQKAQDRQQLLMDKFDRLSLLQEDSQEHKELLLEIKNELDIKRDALKPVTGDNARMDLNKSDEISYRNELAVLKNAFDLGFLREKGKPAESAMGVYNQRRQELEDKYKARSRSNRPATPAAPFQPPAAEVTPAKVLRFNPATGKFE